MIDVYTWKTPNGRKVPIMLEELEVGYHLHGVDIGSPERPSAFRAASANNKIPAIVDHDTGDGPVALFESGAILTYLADKYGRLLPQEPAARAAALTWTYWHAANVPPTFGQLRQFAILNPEKNEQAIGHFRKEAARLVEVAEARLSNSSYFAGEEYSIADIMNWPSLAVLRTIFAPLLGDSLGETPAIDNWVLKIGSRNAVRNAVAKVNAL